MEPMHDFLQKIEQEYSRIRGRQSILSSIDWQLAAEWETQGVPLQLAIRTMRDVSNQKIDRINSLNYFDQAVQKQFKLWQTANIGQTHYSHTQDQQNTMKSIKSEFEDIKSAALKELITSYSQTNLPAACESIPNQLQRLKPKSFNEVEKELAKIRQIFEKKFVQHFSNDQIETATQKAQEKTEYKFSIQSIQPVIISILLDQYNLKPLTLLPF